MFKKLKDKLAEEVKSSPQRIQQFAQAAQAAVTSASSSISDITNNDLFTIGGDETPQNSPARANSHVGNHFQDVLLNQSPSPRPPDSQVDRDSSTPVNDMDANTHNAEGNVRVRRMSNSSIASDVSFRLPSYEMSSSLYHLQSDMDVSASEAEDSFLSASGPELGRVSKEQLYAAYRRTHQRYSKYRGRYSDLARHYKLLERENAKARSVLVETQDKALRRLSELREQCSLEQSAKAHLENALRLELDEKSLKIDALTTKINLLQSYSADKPAAMNNSSGRKPLSEPVDEIPAVAENLIDLSLEEQNKTIPDSSGEIASLKNKIEKLEQLLAKYKESLKTAKEKSSQLTTEIQIVSCELEKKQKDNEQLEGAVKQLTETRQQVQELKELNKELQEENDSFEAKKIEDIKQLKQDLDFARTEIKRLNSDIEIMNKREEENAISLAENKFSVHKELESKENEIKHLKTNLTAANKEVKSYELMMHELQESIRSLEEERTKDAEKLLVLKDTNVKVNTLEETLNELRHKLQTSEQKNVKMVEDNKCVELELSQEKAEKLAMIDRNNYLEPRIQSLTEENSKKNKQIVDLERELTNRTKADIDKTVSEDENNSLLNELDELKNTWNVAQKENSELKDDIEKFTKRISELENDISVITKENSDLNEETSELKTQLAELRQEKDNMQSKLNLATTDLQEKLQEVQKELSETLETMKNMEKDVQEKVRNEMKAYISEIESNYEQKLSEYENIKNKDGSLIANEISSLENDAENQEISRLKTNYNDLLEYKTSLELKIEDYVKTVSEYKNGNESIVSQNKLMKSTIEKLEIEIKELNEIRVKYDEIFEEKIQLEDKIQKMKDEKSSLDNRLQELEEEKSMFEGKEQNLQEEKSELQEELQKMEDERSMIDNRLQDLEEQKSMFEGKEQNLEEEKIELESRVQKLEEDKSMLDRKVLMLEEEKSKLQDILHKLEDEKSRFYHKLLESDQEKSNLDEKVQNWEVEKSTMESRILKLEEENRSMQCKWDELVNEIDNSRKELLEISEAHTIIVQEKDKLEMKIAQLEDSDKRKTEEAKRVYNDNISKNEEVRKNIEKLKEEMDSMLTEKTKLNNQILELQFEGKEKDKVISEFTDSKDVWQQKLATILEENNLLQEKCERLKQEKETIHEKVIILEQKISEYDRKIMQQEEAGIEKEFLDLRIKQLESDLKTTNSEKVQILSDNEKLQKEVAETLNDRKDKIQVSLETIAQLRGEIKTLKDEKSLMEKQLTNENSERNSLNDKVKAIQDISEQEKGILEENIKELKEKNDSSVGKIEELEKSIQNIRESNEKLEITVKELENKCAECNTLREDYDNLKRDKEVMNERLKTLQDLEMQYGNLLSEYERVKNDKSKLVNEFEGLQVHLTKVTKDNSQLNDRIREMIVNEGETNENLENLPDKKNSDVTLSKLMIENEHLKEQVKRNDDLISSLDDLERQHSILLEEKLELEDQLKLREPVEKTNLTEIRDETDKELELRRLAERNNKLIESRNQLESKLADMELVGRSGESNFRQLETKNERLRLTNEKLERKLDEALVSLRHLRALEESTELEYLKNILYEYLTGPGTHSVTLAKVLAAVVKFDDRQTHLVMQREKERQGLLGQLGLL